MSETINPTNEVQLNHIAKAFRELREEWFNSHLRSHAHEREWETETQEVLRELDNDKTKQNYDIQTEFIIAGGTCPVQPRCLNDMIIGTVE